MRIRNSNFVDWNVLNRVIDRKALIALKGGTGDGANGNNDGEGNDDSVQTPKSK